MPSMNRPSWRGVSTPIEQSTMHYITEGLSQLERSTTLLRQNLTNYLSDTDPQRPGDSESPDLIVNTASEVTSGCSTVEIPEVDHLTREVDEILQQNETLKFRVQEVLEANASFKADMKSYLEDSARWKDEFVEETRKIEIELQAVMVHRSNQIQDSDTSESNGISCGLKSKLRTWYNVAEIYGRNTLTNLKQKWNSLEVTAGAMQLDMRNNPLHLNSFFDTGLTY